MEKAENKKIEQTLSLRIIYRVMGIVSLVIMVVLMLETISASNHIDRLKKDTDSFIEIQEDSYDLLTDVDYLSTETQRFVTDFDMQHLDNYFYEVEITRNKDEAFRRLGRSDVSNELAEKLDLFIKDTQQMMNSDYYVMVLVAQAKDYDISTYPELMAVNISSRDRNLSSEEKLDRANELINSTYYQYQYDTVHADLVDFMTGITEYIREVQKESIAITDTMMVFIRTNVIILIIEIAGMLYVTSHMAINPIINSTERINDNLPLVDSGAAEFRYLVKAYNSMYNSVMKNIEDLNYDVIHDPLTGAYNRSGFEMLRNGMNVHETAIIFVDADDFKEVNDTYGHTTGDAILKRIVNSLNYNFRSEDYVCRLGGDEFVVLMQHVNEKQADLIKRKIKSVNKYLAEGGKNVPPASVSVGAAFGSRMKNFDELYKMADSALYESKAHGKGKCTIYKSNTKKAEYKPA